MNIRKTVLSVALAPLFATALMTGSSFADTSVGAFVKHDAWQLETIDAWNVDTARQAATINVFSSFDHNWWGHLRYQAGNIVSRGSTPMITWMPYTIDNPDVSILEEIIDGKHNDYIYSWVDGFQAWLDTYPADQQPRIALRFGHEFNGTWYPWGDQPNALKAAWRHVHNIFEMKNINHAVDWVWNANNVDVDSHNDITLYYPGDDVVDWVSIDGYNWGSNYSFTSWKSFDETFSDMYVRMVENYPNKPIMLAEVSTAEPHDLPDPLWGQDGDDSDALESKELWISDMMQRIKESYPAIKSIVWFNTNKELDWGLNLEGNTGLAAYNNAVVDDYFSGSLDIASFGDANIEISDDTTSAMEANSISDPLNLYSDGVISRRFAEIAADGISENLVAVPNQKTLKADKKRAKRLARAKRKLRRLASSKKPIVRGKLKLNREARGLRKMNRKALRKLRLKNIFQDLEISKSAKKSLKRKLLKLRKKER